MSFFRRAPPVLLGNGGLRHLTSEWNTAKALKTASLNGGSNIHCGTSQQLCVPHKEKNICHDHESLVEYEINLNVFTPELNILHIFLQVLLFVFRSRTRVSPFYISDLLYIFLLSALLLRCCWPSAGRKRPQNLHGLFCVSVKEDSDWLWTRFVLRSVLTGGSARSKNLTKTRSMLLWLQGCRHWHAIAFCLSRTLELTAPWSH